MKSKMHDFVLLTAIGVLLGMIAHAADGLPPHCVGRKVTSIGGCDLFGYCGVTFSDGTTGTLMTPSIGKVDEVCN